MKINSNTNGLNIQKLGLKDRVDPRLRQAAEGMEAQFLKLIIRQMRNSVPESDETKNNQALQVFRGMLDDHYAESAAKGQGIGLAEMIIKQLTGEFNQVNQQPPTVETIYPNQGNKIKQKE